MKFKFPILIGLAAMLAFTVGCKSIVLTPGSVQQGVATGVSLSVAKYPQATPYLQAAEPVICSEANGTNLAPAQVVAAIQASGADQFKTPEGAMILNIAMALYVGLWEKYGVKAVEKSEKLRSYLQATCAGIHQGLLAAPPDQLVSPAAGFPLVTP